MKADSLPDLVKMAARLGDPNPDTDAELDTWASATRSPAHDSLFERFSAMALIDALTTGLG
jgi:hypothetical protein